MFHKLKCTLMNITSTLINLLEYFFIADVQYIPWFIFCVSKFRKIKFM